MYVYDSRQLWCDVWQLWTVSTTGSDWVISFTTNLYSSDVVVRQIVFHELVGTYGFVRLPVCPLAAKLQTGLFLFHSELFNDHICILYCILTFLLDCVIYFWQCNVRSTVHNVVKLFDGHTHTHNKRLSVTWKWVLGYNAWEYILGLFTNICM